MVFLSANSTYVGSSYIADKGVYVDKWQYIDPQFDYHISVVPKDNCVPVAYTYAGEVYVEGVQRK